MINDLGTQPISTKHIEKDFDRNDSNGSGARVGVGCLYKTVNSFFHDTLHIDFSCIVNNCGWLGKSFHLHKVEPYLYCKVRIVLKHCLRRSPVQRACSVSRRLNLTVSWTTLTRRQKVRRRRALPLHRHRAASSWRPETRHSAVRRQTTQSTPPRHCHPQRRVLPTGPGPLSCLRATRHRLLEVTLQAGPIRNSQGSPENTSQAAERVSPGHPPLGARAKATRDQQRRRPPQMKTGLTCLGLLAP